MNARVHLPPALRPEAGGAGTIDIDCADVGDALATLTSRHPTLRRHLFDDAGALRPHVNVFVNQASLRTLNGWATPLAAGDDIHIVPSIAGG